MNIQLGNLKLEDIVKKGHLKEIQGFLDNNGFKREERCDDIEKVTGNYHIFDIPRLFIICGKNKMNDFIDFLKKHDLVDKAFIGKLGLSYRELKVKKEK